MSTAAATLERTSTTPAKAPKPLRHIFCRCDRDAPTRLSFCGIRKGPGVGTPYDPLVGDPDLCAVCVDLQKLGCKRCTK